MRIFITSVGTRGDVEPFLAIGEILQRRGHQITYAFPQQFSQLVPKTADFFALSPRIIELIQSKQGQIMMGKANIFKKLRALKYLYKQGKVINNAIAKQHFEALQATQPELIIHNPKCSYPFIWGLNKNISTILISPVPYIIHKVDHHPHLGFQKNLGKSLNHLTYKLSNYGLVKTIYDIQKKITDKTTLFSKKEILKELMNKKIIYSISPSLFKAPKYWPKNTKVLGYYHRDISQKWLPTDKVKLFLKTYNKPVFLSFGSMQSNQAQKTSKLLYAVFDKLKIPVIVNTAEKGLIALETYSNKNRFLFVNEIPYNWIMSKVYAVVHHGGSGTTHTGIKHACPTLIIPHIIDQYIWNNLIYELGIGPKGNSINRLTSNKFEKALNDLYENKKYKTNANVLSTQINKENIKEKILNFIKA
ncbi:glycosyltransferase [Flavobacteriaceae bacterium 14752]|uniref:glycosyltransferase n=1 Tax=Mesohalobacter salilacus TaxID=2491711 RepID=UPI000F64079D|nr:glycosyltransferase [Flavobacteriaceae bacterium 14752]